MAKKVAKKLRIRLVRSTIGRLQVQKDTVRALGLRKMHQTVEHADTPALRGMINRVAHLVTVDEV
ncbi:50S ribosomal protein L30 [candidate division KSB1 bacterium]|nr:50S ribosomal protein L30 [candidate division KSB1 bacterium]RQW04914.1 MAG: 50S ribosomal protein L30 [candidate division KSB1 bacterium]